MFSFVFLLYETVQKVRLSCNFYLKYKFNTLASGCFRGFLGKNLPKRTWLCTGISSLLYGLRTWSKRQKTQQVF